MDINITIKVDLDEIKELLVNADDLQQWVLGHINDLKCYVENIQEYGMAVNNPVEPDEMPAFDIKRDAPDVEPEQEATHPVENEIKVSLEEVRAKLASLSQAGKQEQVKELIQKFNAKKLTEIPEAKYPELLQAAGKL